MQALVDGPRNLARVNPAAGAGTARLSPFPGHSFPAPGGIRWGGGRPWRGGLIPRNLPGGWRTWTQYGIWPWSGYVWPYYPTYIATVPSQRPRNPRPQTPQEVYGRSQLSQEEADRYCSKILWPFCNDPENAGRWYCRTYAGWCLKVDDTTTSGFPRAHTPTRAGVGGTVAGDGMVTIRGRIKA